MHYKNTSKVNYFRIEIREFILNKFKLLQLIWHVTEARFHTMAKVLTVLGLTCFVANLVLYWALCTSPWSLVPRGDYCWTLYPTLYPLVKCAPIMCLIVVLFAEVRDSTRRRTSAPDTGTSTAIRLLLGALPRQLIT